MNTSFEEKVTLRLDSVTLQLESMTKSIGKLATKDELKETVDKAVDGLAFAVKKGLDEVHEKISNIEFKIERMDTRFTNQLDYFNLYCPTRNEFTELDARMKKVERKLKT